ncbi:MAG: DEAD/DEAH box helicase [Crenarchaeota archaeon]|nr:DEAD/DEAH box helicase [Thermoproteota archaeon]MCR8489089.1 DEAD/DEAH box helicase [Thermoproteota archaeon]
MNMKQRVKIGNVIIESSKEFPWSKIKELAEHMKKVAKWDPEQRTWIVSWRIFSRLSEFLEFINKELMTTDNQYAYKIMEIIEKLIEKVPKHIVDDENGVIYTLLIDLDSYEVSKQVNKSILPIRLVEKKVHIDDIGEITVKYLAMNSKKILEVVNSGEVNKLPPALKEAILEVKPKPSKPTIIVKVTKNNRILVRVPKSIPSELVEDLKELGTIHYFVEVAEGGHEERIAEAFKLFERFEYIDIYLPPFTAGFVEDVARKYNVDINVDYQLPDKKLDNLQENFQLYPHQLQALAKWIENGCRGTIVLPTGGGKTIVGIAAIARLKVPTIVFVPNVWLLEQWRERIAEFTGIPKYQIGVLGWGEKSIKDITVATYQSGVKNIGSLSGRFWLVIYDECHHVPARTFKKVAMNMRAPYKMALSATPKRRDKNEILLFKLAGKIVHSVSYPELVRRGLVAPMVYRLIYVPLPLEKMLEYRSVEGEIQGKLDDIKRKLLVNRMIAIAQENPAKIEVIKEIVKKHKDEKIFIFAPTIKFAKSIAKEVNKIVPAAALTAEASKSEEEKIIEKFKSCLLQALVIIRKAEEGVDVGEASVAIIAGGSKQEREFIQRIGRVLRLDPQKTKVAWVYEIVSENTIEESMAAKRGGLKLVKELADYIIKKYNIAAIKKVRWEPGKSID